MDRHISVKTNRVLNIIIIGLLLILTRVWYLSVIQKESYTLQARKPQRRCVIEHAERGTIQDRFGVPLAINRMSYKASIIYADIRQIPSLSWQKTEGGKAMRIQPRLTYIQELSRMLAEELGMDAVAIEDKIHGKASLFPHTPFLLKEGLSETQYYRLKMREKDWLGLRAERSSQRIYPQGKVGGDIIGYIGAISQKEYAHIARETEQLQAFVADREAGEMPYLPKGFNSPVEVRERLKELKEKAYTLNDMVGKSGIESVFDETLRGFYGKKTYEVSVKGNFLRELPGTRNPVSGQRVVLSLSAELQEFAESLLAKHEEVRNKRYETKPSATQLPWIKGGAIVAMIPQTGEIVALASYPRFDPNDFVPSKEQDKNKLIRWLENEGYIAEIWDGKRPLEREYFSEANQNFYEEKRPLTWQQYLNMILPTHTPISTALENIRDIRGAVSLQQRVFALPQLSGPLDPLLSSIPNLEDRLLTLDLCRILIDVDLFSDSLLASVGHTSLGTFRSHCQAASVAEGMIKNRLKELFHDLAFSQWREKYFKAFLQEKRSKEKKHKRPYTDYLDLAEKKQFEEFWKTHRSLFLETFICGKTNMLEVPELQPFLADLMQLYTERQAVLPHVENLRQVLNTLTPSLAREYLNTMRPYASLTRPLLGRYRNVRKGKEQALEKHLAGAFYPSAGFGYTRSQAYRQSAPGGSFFKLVTAYEALRERFLELSEKHRQIEFLSPLTLVDDLRAPPSKDAHKQILGFAANGEPITRIYKGGRMPQSSHANIGKIDLLGAIEQSSNIYFSILATEHIQDPGLLIQAARQFGFGARTGIDLPGEIKGVLPDDLGYNRTGLYSFAIGHHTLVVTPIQAAVMLSTIGNGGPVPKPRVTKTITGKRPSYEEELFFPKTRFPFKNSLSLLGISFPLFTETCGHIQSPFTHQTPVEIKRSLFFPHELRHTLLWGMQRAVLGARGSARAALIRILNQTPSALQSYLDVQKSIVGKTGTAEVMYKGSIDAGTLGELKKHVWFLALSFPEQISQAPTTESWPQPDLAVVVYLRFAGAGREGAPLATQIIKKWRELQATHQP